MDIFDVLKAVLNRKMEFVRSGIDEKDALKRAEYDVSKEYNILLADVKKIDKSDIYYA